MWKKFASTHPTPPAQHCPLKLFGLALTVCLVLVSIGLSSLAIGETRVPSSNPRIPGTMIACFHKTVGRFTAQVEPARCDLAGHEAKTRRVVRFPIEDIRWQKWGRFRSLGFRGVDRSKQTHVRVVAYRRVECADGRVFYSSANILNLRNGNAFAVNLPTCNNSSLIG